MGRLAHCKLCGIAVTSEERVKYKQGFYCAKCYASVSKDSEEYKKLISYVCEMFGIEKPTGLMLTQIKDYKNNYSYTYGGMWYTLWYYTTMLQKDITVSYSLAFIKFHYENAKQYFIEEQKRINKAQALNQAVKERFLTRKARCNVPHNLLVNIEDIIKGGDIH